MCDRRSTSPSSDARDLIDHFITRQLVFGAGRSIRAKKHTHDVASVLTRILLDQSPRKFADIVQPGAETAVLARGQVPDVVKHWPWDEPPGFLEDEVVPRRVERGLDAIDYWDMSV